MEVVECKTMQISFKTFVTKKQGKKQGMFIFRGAKKSDGLFNSLNSLVIIGCNNTQNPTSSRTTRSWWHSQA